MSKTARDEDLVECPPVVATSPGDIAALMEEAVAVDALFRRMRRGAIDTASALMAYLSAQDDASATASDKEERLR